MTTASRRVMQLTPRQPPGRKSRKARSFAAEIHRLRTEGYTCEAIREALADVGVQVSASTVQREAVRQARRPTASHTAPKVTAPHAPPASTPRAPQGGREIAEAFMRDRNNNPLLRNKEPR